METPEREAYRMKCRYYSEPNGHCRKQSGPIGYRFVANPIRCVPIGFIDILCTPDTDCARMKRYDKLHQHEK